LLKLDPKLKCLTLKLEKSIDPTKHFLEEKNKNNNNYRMKKTSNSKDQTTKNRNNKM